MEKKPEKEEDNDSSPLKLWEKEKRNYSSYNRNKKTEETPYRLLNLRKGA